jgi:hypothetical protein
LPSTSSSATSTPQSKAPQASSKSPALLGIGRQTSLSSLLFDVARQGMHRSHSSKKRPTNRSVTTMQDNEGSTSCVWGAEMWQEVSTRLTAIFSRPTLLENGQLLENSTNSLAESSSRESGRCAFDGMEWASRHTFCSLSTGLTLAFGLAQPTPKQLPSKRNVAARITDYGELSEADLCVGRSDARHFFNIATPFTRRQNYLTAFKEMLDHCIRAQRDSEAISQYLHLRAMVSIAKRTFKAMQATDPCCLPATPLALGRGILAFLQCKASSTMQAPCPSTLPQGKPLRA